MTTLDLTTITLESGGHSRREDGVCIMELVAWIAGVEHTDRPACVSPVIASFLRSWNDAMDDTDRQMLKPYAASVLNTATTAEDEETRAWMLTDWLARECAPAWLRLAGLKDQAVLLEQLAPLTSTDTAKSAQPTLDRGRKDAAAAWDVAGSAAGAAAWDAARAAAWDAAGAAARAAGAAAGAAARAAGDAARAAAWDAAGAAARDAAWLAAGAAARAAARAALRPTTEGLQASALLLLDRMIAVGKTEDEPGS